VNGAHANFWPIAVMMLFAGIGIPIMATLNAGVGQQLQNPVAASVMLFVVALALCALALITTGAPSLDQLTAVPAWRYLGAGLVVFYILSITWAGPRIGIGNAVFFVLLGQLIATAAIDHWGLWGAPITPLSVKRALGIAVMALGVWLAKKPL
jgi:transporter family-2 protein